MGLRHTGREAALRILYSMEYSGEDETSARESYWQGRKGSASLKEYAAGLVAGAAAHRERLDELIANASPKWKPERISTLDRCLLRMAAFELAECPSVPSAVIVNEAVEIAREYAGDESARFIHGVLGAVAKETRPAKDPEADD